MFKLKYNIAVGAQILLGMVNSVLLIKVFGVSGQTDVYFMLQALFSAVYLVQYMPVEQFLYFYNDAKVHGRDNAERFYNYALFVAALTGLVSVAGMTFFGHFAASAFAAGLDPARMTAFAELIGVYKWVLLVMPLVYVSSALLTAEMKIGYPYVFTTVPTACVIAAQLYCYKTGRPDVVLLVKAGLLGILANALLNLYFARRTVGYRLGFVCRHEFGARFIKNSFSMRFGHNIHNFLFPVITNNFLAMFPVGFVSYYNYAQKIASVLQAVITGPSSKILQSKISAFWSTGDAPAIRRDVRRYLEIFSLVFAAAGVGCYFVIPWVFNFIAAGKVTPEGIGYVQVMYLLLSVWNFLVFVENPFDVILIAGKNSRVFIAVNSVFIAVYFLLAMALWRVMGVYALFAALLAGQCFNFCVYYFKARGALASLERKSAA